MLVGDGGRRGYSLPDNPVHTFLVESWLPELSFAVEGWIHTQPLQPIQLPAAKIPQDPERRVLVSETGLTEGMTGSYLAQLNKAQIQILFLLGNFFFQ